MFTRWEVADPTTIENRAAASAAAINHPPINHCHLALRQPHAGPRGAPARSPPGMLGNEGWQRGGIQASGYDPCWEERDGVSCEGAQACLRWVGGAARRSVRFHVEERQDELSASWGGVGGGEWEEVAARSSWRRRIWDYCWHVGWSELKTPQKYLLIACQSKGGSWTLKAFRLTLTVW